MSDLIERQAVLDAIDKWYSEAENEMGIMETIENLPPVQLKAETVTEFADRCRECGERYGKLLKEKTGRWIESNGVGMFVCSVCNESFYPMPTCLGKPLMKYCPHCGARMVVEK